MLFTERAVVQAARDPVCAPAWYSAGLVVRQRTASRSILSQRSRLMPSSGQGSLDRLSCRMETAPPPWDINVGHNAREPSAGPLADSGLSWRTLIASMYHGVSLMPPSY